MSETIPLNGSRKLLYSILAGMGAVIILVVANILNQAADYERRLRVQEIKISAGEERIRVLEERMREVRGEVDQIDRHIWGEPPRGMPH